MTKTKNEEIEKEILTTTERIEKEIFRTLAAIDSKKKDLLKIETTFTLFI